MKTSHVDGQPVFDMYSAMLLGYAGWEGWDRGVFAFGIVVGVVYVVVYSLVSRIFGNAIERMRRALLRHFHCNAMSRFSVHVISYLIYLVFCYFLFLALAWQTILLYVKVFKS